MSNVTISDLTAVTLPLDGSELLEIERSGASYKIHSGDVGQSPPSAIAVTSNPVAVNINPLGVYYEVTTSGSAGVEIINIPNYPLDGNGYNGQLIGRKTIIYLKTLTNPADILQITADGQAVLDVYEAQRSNTWYRSTSANGVRMGTEGMAVCLIWAGYNWNYSILAGSFNDDTLFSGSNSQFFGPATDVGSVVAGGGQLRGASTTGTGTGGAARVNAGDSTAGRGGDVTIGAGGGGGTGDGGNVHITAGVASGSGLAGNVMLDTLPTVDPGVSGALWADPVTHILKVSP